MLVSKLKEISTTIKFKFEQVNARNYVPVHVYFIVEIHSSFGFGTNARNNFYQNPAWRMGEGGALQKWNLSSWPILGKMYFCAFPWILFITVWRANTCFLSSIVLPAYPRPPRKGVLESSSFDIWFFLFLFCKFVSLVDKGGGEVVTILRYQLQAGS